MQAALRFDLRLQLGTCIGIEPIDQAADHPRTLDAEHVLRVAEVGVGEFHFAAHCLEYRGLGLHGTLNLGINRKTGELDRHGDTCAAKVALQRLCET